MSSVTHSQRLEEICRSKGNPCMAIGDYYCADCEQEAGPDPDAGWLGRMLDEARREKPLRIWWDALPLVEKERIMRAETANKASKP